MSEAFQGIIVPPPYMPYHWYWKAEDGRVFASERELIVDEADADFIAWTEGGRLPTEWPRDDAGVQTNAALQDVLTPYGLTVALETFAASYLDEALAEGFTVDGIDYAYDQRTRDMILIAGLHHDGAQLIAKDGSVHKLDQPALEKVIDELQAMIEHHVGNYGKALEAVKSGKAKSKQQVVDIFKA